MGNITDFLNNSSGQVSAGGVIISIVSIVLAYLAYHWSKNNARQSLINANSWETYKLYNSPEVLRGRRVARDVAKVETWNTVRDQATYQQFFAAYGARGAQVSASAADPLSNPDQELHYLLNYYHQVGMLLERGMLDEDFTLLLVGGGLKDRWDVVGRVPTIYDDSPYQGIYTLYDRYKIWLKTRYPQLIARAGATRADITANVHAGQKLQF